MRRFIYIFLVIAFLTWPLEAGHTQQQVIQSDLAGEMLARMTPEERVGQLFLVTFKGSELDPEDPIFDLIINHHVAGVLLKASNDNYVDAPDTLTALQELISSLQDAEYNASVGLGYGLVEAEETQKSVYVPLFIATRHEGGGVPYSEILSGLSEIPAPMAIGATWDTSLSYAVGEVLGGELEALGFNLLLGPSLDVLEEPRLVREGDLGVRSFGGDPYWVSEMGRAFIAGLHAGSENQLGVIAKHFPGLGSADRPIEEEVATIRKSLEQLKQIELAPFFAVTRGLPGEDESIADGLLTSHIRYQGFQGNVRATTRPISFDPQAYAQLMDLEPLSSWHAGGGLTVSDSLGSRAVRRFRDPLNRTFKAHLVARDAFLAGNDLLLLSDFQDPEDPDEATSIRATLDFFAQKYREDLAFAQRVDEAVLRILSLKLRLYGNAFTPSRVRPSAQNLSRIGTGEEITARVARTASTLISPAQEEIEERIGGPPRLGERVVFFTDVRIARQCSNCLPQPGMDVGELEAAVLRLYGQAAAGQVGSWSLTSFSMADLAHYLGEPPPVSLETPLTPREDLEDPIISAKWLVFSVMNSSQSVYGSNSLKLLLDQRPDLARSKHLVVFAHDVPYGLDATDISKVDVYYALYGSTPLFIDVAAHLLFLEQTALGASPVSVPGVGYDLIDVTSPDPDQVISLSVHAGNGEVPPGEASPEFSVGDIIRVATGVIVDANGNPVPDGTVVEFVLVQQSDGLTQTTVEATTQLGVAETSVSLERLGLLTITARSDPARISETLQLNVQEDIPALATVISPTLIPTPSPEPTPTPLAPTPTVPIETSDGDTPESADVISFLHFLLGLVGVSLVGGVGYASMDRETTSPSTRLRCILLPVIGGLLGYNYVALGLPGSHTLLQSLGALAGFIVAIGLGAVGLIAARLWCSQN